MGCICLFGFVGRSALLVVWMEVSGGYWGFVGQVLYKGALIGNKKASW